MKAKHFQETQVILSKPWRCKAHSQSKFHQLGLVTKRRLATKTYMKWHPKPWCVKWCLCLWWSWTASTPSLDYPELAAGFWGYSGQQCSQPLLHVTEFLHGDSWGSSIAAPIHLLHPDLQMQMLISATLIFSTNMVYRWNVTTREISHKQTTSKVISVSSS